MCRPVKSSELKRLELSFVSVTRVKESLPQGGAFHCPVPRKSVESARLCYLNLQRGWLWAWYQNQPGASVSVIQGPLDQVRAPEH